MISRRFRLLVAAAILLLSEDPCIAEVSPAPIVSAAEKGEWLTVLQLLKAGADPNASNREGITALFWASWRNKTEVVRALIIAGANVNHQSKRDATALIQAALHGSTEAARELLRAGANFNLRNSYGESPLFLAVAHGHSEIEQMLRDAGAKEDIDPRVYLIGACHRGDVRQVWDLLEKGANPYEGFLTGSTFHCAARYNKPEVMEMLIEQSKDSPLPGENLLALAAHEGHIEVLQVLLKKGFYRPKDLEKAMVEAIERALYTPNSETIARMLLEAGLNPRPYVDGFGSFVHQAASHIRLESLSYW